MNVVIIKNYPFFSFINKIESEKLGLYFSFLIHFIILLFVIGLPNFFERAPINVPTIIPIEIVNVTDNTSIPEKIEKKEKEVIKETKDKQTVVESKKFNSSNNQEIKKIQEKIKIEPTKNENIKTPKDDIIIKEKVKTPIKLEKQKDITIKEKVETLPTKKIMPKIKPKPKNFVPQPKKTDVAIKVEPKPKPTPEFSIASMLKDLRNEKSTTPNKDKEVKKKISDSDKIDKETNKENLQLSISEIDLLRQQLTSCWIAPAGAVIEKGMTVKISAKLKENRTIYDNSVRIVDTNISKNNSFFGPITESAMRTLLHPDCTPLKLPEKKYNLWKNLTITFDYSIMKGYE
tara:strand:+ start:1713 stop:2750 length:1038 start_codon:yes stop_codon:yes gene_type:complete